jgi:hypothetical protein
MDKLRALIKEPKDARWFPSEGEEYFFINTMLAVSFLKFNPEHHDCVARRDVGNCFETESAANELALRFRNCAQAYNLEIEAKNKGTKADFSDKKPIRYSAFTYRENKITECAECKKRGAATCYC